MATFPSYKPTYSASKKSDPRITTVQFGDGYQKRVAFGLNQNPKEWSLSFNVKDSDANIIEAFLDARAADAANFDWTPPDSSTSYKWVCPSWTRELFDFQRSTINVTFKQVFEP
jgi:phage-related protein